MTDAELFQEIESQVWSYIELSAMYETQPTIRGFINHLDESYDDKI